MSKTTEKISPEAERAIRNDERQKLSALVRDNAEMFAELGSNKMAAVKLVALAIGLNV